MFFVDEVTITIESGHGGSGLVAWRRESHVPKGGPAGGNGGRGGDVILHADPSLGTLLDYRYRKTIKAEPGQQGGQSRRDGADGTDAIIRVPVGTVVTDATTGATLVDMDTPWQLVVVAKGGRGGKGNAFFATAVNQAPDRAQPGEEGTVLQLRLTLKLLADIGIVGLPNAGKSSLISRISNARPKIADYPFTTLVPNLGVVGIDESSFVVADMPGLIEGASSGIGLGIRFLRHVERTSAILLLVSPNMGNEPPTPVQALEILRKELSSYSDGVLARRPWLVALNKMDLPDTADWIEPLEAWCHEKQVSFHAISVATGQGVKPVLRELARIVDESRAKNSENSLPF